MGIDILGIDIMGVDILGIDIPAPTQKIAPCKHVRVMKTPLPQLLYSETGVYRGIPFLFLL